MTRRIWQPSVQGQQGNGSLNDVRQRATSQLPRRRNLPSQSPWFSLLLIAICTTKPVFAFRPASYSYCTNHRVSLSLKASVDEYQADEIERLQAKARLLLEKSKEKLSKGTPAESETEKEAGSPLPFFASKESSSKRNLVVKTEDEETGLITTDGEKMAEIAETEAWEARPLFEVFKNEIDENEDVYSLAAQQLASRDVAASIWNLRKQLQNSDYKQIFDKNNRFIGEDN